LRLKGCRGSALNKHGKTQTIDTLVNKEMWNHKKGESLVCVASSKACLVLEFYD